MLHFVKIVVLVQGVFAGIVSEISVFCPFFGKKIYPKRTAYHWTKTLHFVETVVLVQGVFPVFYSEKSLFAHLSTKSTKKNDVS